MDTEVGMGVKSYPLPLAQAMEEFIREVAGVYLCDEVIANTVHGKAEKLVEVLHKWR